MVWRSHASASALGNFRQSCGSLHTRRAKLLTFLQAEGPSLSCATWDAPSTLSDVRWRDINRPGEGHSHGLGSRHGCFVGCRHIKAPPCRRLPPNRYCIHLQERDGCGSSLARLAWKFRHLNTITSHCTAYSATCSRACQALSRTSSEYLLVSGVFVCSKCSPYETRLSADYLYCYVSFLDCF